MRIKSKSKVKCNLCNGKGVVYHVDYEALKQVGITCPKCQGEKYIDGYVDINYKDISGLILFMILVAAILISVVRP